MARLTPSGLLGRLGAILLVSGFCSLVYQVVWLRLLRLIFGASTASSAAVLAIFMGGLGLGGLVLGRRVDRTAKPLTFYFRLEIGIAVTAALTPPLVELIRWIYVTLGGTPRLGLVPGTLLRLGLSALVLGVPSFFMGGTLPAAVRAVEQAADRGRRGVGLFYGVNTLGAVLGTLWATFLSIELVGLRRSLWVAALLNLLIAILARALARRAGEMGEAATAEGTASPPDEPAPGSRKIPRGRLGLVLVAAMVVGFVFFLMELVWYRMLAPILGGSSYTFGLILAVALAGIGLGGLLYGAGERQRRPTLLTFAGNCSLLALAVIVPYALGDKIAFLALVLRDLGQGGFGGLILGWSAVTAVVVLPAALVAGFQFPVLVGLLGSGREDVGREVGLAYAWNTAGAILGSVAGGFGLLPLLSAPGAWILSMGILVLLAGAFLGAQLAGRGSPGRSHPARVASVVALALVAVTCATAAGPTAAWRHSGIGAGRLDLMGQSPNDLLATFSQPRADLTWEAEGRESSVAIRTWTNHAFLVNGKSDGSARSDAPTQVMSGLVGALLHPRPRHALVVGLGTGSSGGWLADVPGMERVDVVELEPAIAEVARRMAAVNRGALDNPRLRLLFGDAREHLLTSQERYDVIFSEPSNPYRAGVSSLFTEEFYRAVSHRLTEDGLFLQWLQAYEVDAEVLRLAYATLLSVFPHVETWQVHYGDLLLVASGRPVEHDLVRIRRRVAQEPFASALSQTWGVSGAEGLYSGYVASPAFSRRVAEAAGNRANTDDRPHMEFGFVRNLGRKNLYSVARLRGLSRRLEEHRPVLSRGELDWDRVDDQVSARAVAFGFQPLGIRPNGAHGHRLRARAAYVEKDFPAAVRAWFAQSQEPRSRADAVLVAHSLVAILDPRAPEYIELLATFQATEALTLRAIWDQLQGRPERSLEGYVKAFGAYRQDPWPIEDLMEDAILRARQLAHENPETAGRRLWQLLEDPFLVGLLDQARLRVRLDLAAAVDFEGLCLEALESYEPYPLWEGALLGARMRCYDLHDHPLFEQALEDVETFLANEPPRLLEGDPSPESLRSGSREPPQDPPEESPGPPAS